MLRRVPCTSTRMSASPGTRKVWVIEKLPPGCTRPRSIVPQPLPVSEFCRWSSTRSPTLKGDTVPVKVTLCAGPVSRFDPSAGPLRVTSENTRSCTLRLRAPSDFTYQLRLLSTTPGCRKKA